MSAATAAPRREGGRGLVLRRAVAAELIKIMTLRGWWTGAGVVLVLTAVFAVINTGLIVEDVGGLAPDQSYRDFDGSVVPVKIAVLDGVLFPVYQGAAFFLPVVIALVVSQEHRHRQVLVSAIAVPSRVVLFAAKLTAVVTASAALSLAASLVTDVVLLVMLPARLHAVVLSSTGLTIPVRLVVYAVAVGVLAAALTSIVRSTLVVLVAVVLLFLLAVTNLLLIVSPILQQVLPLVGARAFLLDLPPDPGALGPGGGLLLLLAWSLVPAVAWGATFVVRDLA